MLLREGYQERGALAKNTPRRDRATMALGDSSAHCKADAGSLVLLASMQPLKDREDAIEVFFLEADAIILHRKDAGIPLEAGIHQNLGRNALAVKLHRVAEKILEKLSHLQSVSFDHGKLPERDFGPGLLDPDLEVGEDLLEDLGEVRGFEGLGLRGHARVGEQVLD